MSTSSPPGPRRGEVDMKDEIPVLQLRERLPFPAFAQQARAIALTQSRVPRGRWRALARRRDPDSPLSVAAAVAVVVAVVLAVAVAGGVVAAAAFLVAVAVAVAVAEEPR